MKKKGHPLAARVKKMMHKDEDVGKLAAATPVLLGAQTARTAPRGRSRRSPAHALLSLRSKGRRAVRSKPRGEELRGRHGPQRQDGEPQPPVSGTCRARAAPDALHSAVPAAIRASDEGARARRWPPADAASGRSVWDCGLQPLCDDQPLPFPSRSKAYVNSDKLMDFLQDTVSEAATLPTEDQPAQPKQRKQRCALLVECAALPGPVLVPMSAWQLGGALPCWQHTRTVDRRSGSRYRGWSLDQTLLLLLQERCRPAQEDVSQGGGGGSGGGSSAGSSST